MTRNPAGIVRRTVLQLLALVLLAPLAACGDSPARGVPRGDLPGWKQVFFDDFDRDAPVGSWANECSPYDVAYTGAQGQRWLTYPRCYLDTFDRRPYRADEVLSVSDGRLVFDLHNVDGVPAGANPSPVLDTGSQYQTYGRYSVRMRVDEPDLDEYYVAWLLWPQSEQWPRDGELDFPEGWLSRTVGGYQHFAGEGACDGCKIQSRDIGARFTDWHTYTIEWTPGRVRYLLDDTVVLDSTQWVPTTPMRWQLQTETRGDGDSRGRLLVDWAAVWSYDR
ncbi:glycoside hydrolase family 16 protein [Gordonia terrae]